MRISLIMISCMYLAACGKPVAQLSAANSTLQYAPASSAEAETLAASEQITTDPGFNKQWQDLKHVAISTYLKSIRRTAANTKGSFEGVLRFMPNADLTRFCFTQFGASIG